MKFTLSLAVLALAASQAMAVVPTPIAECTKTVIVQPTDTGCADFAAVNGCTFDDMLKWNLKLRPDCLNLDVGHPICVSVTPGGPATAPVAVPTTVGKPATGATTTASPSASAPASASASASTSAGVQPTSSAASQSAPVGSTSSSAATTSPTGSTPDTENAANGNKASMAIGAAGALLSALYML
ncbi:hypothetical protein BG011_007109 [Mortierella polycephala]|uniref:LysM domain-containing protein n=1 Tax=Mortierella polycephala TaxID=41804 RepID=A0A9P6PUB5_9FUNG|nr:hypothetical protein BG011_007109 [Mortierella polycephala]